MRKYPILIIIMVSTMTVVSKIQALVSFTVNLKLDLIKSECEATINANLGLFPTVTCSCNEPDKSSQQCPEIYGTLHIPSLTLNKGLSV